jgi:hypothetical protein
MIHPDSEKDYWYSLQAVVAQFDGLAQGVQDFAAPGESLTVLDMLILQAAGDMYDIQPAVDLASRPAWEKITDEREFHDKYEDQTSCSALVTIINGTVTTGEVYAGHTTWTSYANMLRIYKHYDLNLADTPNSRVSFSSKPGSLYSKDDFYTLPDTKMVVIETTNGIMNSSLYDLIVPESLLTWQRVIVANRLATGGEEWTLTHSYFNSGTYNNQYFVVDMKQFVPGQGALAGFIWISEQIPGLIMREDVSDVVFLLLLYLP